MLSKRFLLLANHPKIASFSARLSHFRKTKKAVILSQSGLFLNFKHRVLNTMFKIYFTKWLPGLSFVDWAIARCESRAQWLVNKFPVIEFCSLPMVRTFGIQHIPKCHIDDVEPP